MSDQSDKAAKDRAAKNTLYCSFCGKSQHEVRKLIAGPTVFICDECVELCMDIIKEESKTDKGISVKDLDPGDKYPIHFGIELPDCAVIGENAPKVASIIAALDAEHISDPKRLEAAIAWIVVALGRNEILEQINTDIGDAESKLENIRTAIEDAGSGSEEEIRLFAKEAQISIDSCQLTPDEEELTRARRQSLEEHLELFEAERRQIAHLEYLDLYRTRLLTTHPLPQEDETAAQ